MTARRLVLALATALAGTTPVGAQSADDKAQVLAGYTLWARQARAELPKKFDAATTLVDVEVDPKGPTLVYRHVVDLETMDDAAIASARRRIGVLMCADEEVARTIARGGALRFIYDRRAEPTRRLAEFTIDACT